MRTASSRDLAGSPGIETLRAHRGPVSPPALVFAVVFGLLALYGGGSVLLRDLDTGFQVRTGEWILSHTEVPRTPVYSEFEGKRPWTAHSWGGMVLMALSHSAAGLSGVVLMFSAVVAAAYAIAASWGRDKGVSQAVAVAVALLAVAAGKHNFLARPALFSILLFAVTHRILGYVRAGRPKRNLLLLPPLFCVWANLHAGFMAGLLLVAAYSAADFVEFFLMKREGPQKRRFLAISSVFIVSLASTLVNPYGPGVYRFVAQTLSDESMVGKIVEFLSPDFQSFVFMPLLILLVVSTLAFMLSPVRMDLAESIVFAGFLYLSLKSNRFSLFLTVAAVPPLLSALSALPRQAVSKLPRIVGWPAAAAVSVAATAYVLSGGIVHAFDPAHSPVGSVKFLKENRLAGRMYNCEQFAALLVYETNGAYRHFIDGRSDVYAGELWNDYLAIGTMAPGWEQLMDEKYGFDVVFYYERMPFSQKLKTMEGKWALLHSDGVGAVFGRRSGADAETIKRIEGKRKGEVSGGLREKAH